LTVTRLQSLPPTRFRVVLVATAAAVALASGGQRPCLIAAAIGLLWVVAMHRRATPSIGPSEERLRIIDEARAREDEAEYVAGGRGEDEYEQLLQALLALARQDVTVVAGGGRRGGWRPLAVLHGRLRSGESVRVEDEPERRCFTVGSGGNGFYVDGERFVRGLAGYRVQPDGALHVEDVDGGTLRIGPHCDARSA
jgi:hypothetical protein